MELNVNDIIELYKEEVANVNHENVMLKAQIIAYQRLLEEAGVELVKDEPMEPMATK